MSDAYRVLARKYRPQTFSDLVGQEVLVRTLSNALASGRIAHAFLLTGIRGIGKTTTARIIAKGLNCVGPDGQGSMTTEPCGVCPNCRMIAEDRHVDVLEMDAASRGGIDEIRDLIETVHYAPTNARYKVYIVDEVHMLSTAAFNALLKTLEEPPPHVIFIFATTELRKIPVTILSRCQRFDLKRLSTDRLVEHLASIGEKESISADAEALRLIAIAAEGSVRDGLSLLDRAIAHAGSDGDAAYGVAVTAEAVRRMLGLADRTRLFDLAEAVFRGEIAAALGRLREQHEDGGDMAMLMQDLLGLAHTLTRLQIAPSEDLGPSFAGHERQRAGELAAALSVPELSRIWQMLLKGLDEVKRAPDALGAAEMVLIRLAHASRLPLPGDILRQWVSGDEVQKHEGNPKDTPPVMFAPRSGVSSSSNAAIAAVPVATARLVEARNEEPRAHLSLAASNPEPLLAGFADVAALAETRREPMLAYHLAHSVESVAFEMGKIELHVLPAAPAGFALQLARFLEQATRQSWKIVSASQRGEATLQAQRAAAQQRALDEAAQHPLAKAILEAFPGSRMLSVRSTEDEA